MVSHIWASKLSIFVFAQVRVPLYATHKPSGHSCAAWCLGDGRTGLTKIPDMKTTEHTWGQAIVLI